MHPGRRASAARGIAVAIEALYCGTRPHLWPVRCCGAGQRLLRHCSKPQAQCSHEHKRNSHVARLRNNTLGFESGGGSRRSATTNTPSSHQRTRSSPSAPGDGGDKGPEDNADESSSSSSFQIGLDPFSQQLLASAATALAAWAIASWAHVDLTSSLRPELEALTTAAQLSAPVLLLLLAVVAPRWAPPYKGAELARLRHNYYMTAQVLQLYLNLDDDEEEDGGSSSSGKSGSSSSTWEDGGGGERARVRRRLRLEQTVGWGTISSGLALMQAYTLQPWNPPTANSVLGLALAGRTVQQLANEFLVRGAVWGVLSSWVAAELRTADASDGILFFGRVFGGPDAIKYAAGLGLVALAVPGALWEARAARNFVRASVVGPVRDAAIFCTGNGVDEPAYCDPAGFAMMAARRPANAAPVADVVTRTRGWRAGPQATYSVGSADAEELGEDMQPLPATATTATTAVSNTNAAAATVDQRESSRHDAPASPPSPTAASASSPSPSSSAAPPSAHTSSELRAPALPTLPPPAHRTTATTATTTTTINDLPASQPPSSTSPPSSPSPFSSAPSSPSSAPPPPAPLPHVGPTLRASSAAFEWDSADMGVLLRVETAQDRLATWVSLYLQLLAAFAINGAFLAADCNLFASLAAAWALRTGPLLLSELRARAAADAAARLQ